METHLRSVSPTGIHYLNPLDINRNDSPMDKVKNTNHVKVPGTGRGRMSIMEKSVSGLYKPRKERMQSPPLAATAGERKSESLRIRIWGTFNTLLRVQSTHHKHDCTVLRQEDAAASAERTTNYTYNYLKEKGRL